MGKNVVEKGKEWDRILETPVYVWESCLIRTKISNFVRWMSLEQTHQESEAFFQNWKKKYKNQIYQDEGEKKSLLARTYSVPQTQKHNFPFTYLSCLFHIRLQKTPVLGVHFSLDSLFLCKAYFLITKWQHCPFSFFFLSGWALPTQVSWNYFCFIYLFISCLNMFNMSLCHCLGLSSRLVIQFLIVRLLFSACYSGVWTKKVKIDN